jgi:OOP family OmpA-OmpF porin
LHARAAPRARGTIQEIAFMKLKLAIGTAALATLASGNVLAQSSQWPSPMYKDSWGYIGASAGQSHYRTDCSSAFNCDRKDTGFKVYGGGRIYDMLGFELGYTDFGKMQASGGDTEAWASGLSLVAGIPIGERFAIFAKGGGVYGKTDVRASAASLVQTGHKTGWGTTYGVGAALGVTRAVQVRVDWDRYNLDFAGGSRDVDMVSAGVQMRF